MKSRGKILLRQLGRLLLLPMTLVARPAHTPEAERQSEAEQETQILLGGQAVIEGVLMRAPRSYCVAVRTSSRGIVEQRGTLRAPAQRWRGFRLPGLRGLGVLGQTLALGLRALHFSANAALEEEAKEAKEAGETKEAKAGKTEGKPQEFPAWLFWLQVAFSVGFFILLYKFLPLVVATQIEKLGFSGGWLGFNLIDGLVRLLLFLGFLYLISLWRDIRRTFEYHGAEHMTVYTWEASRPVTVANARAFPPEHPRCGTSFLMVVMLVSLLLYALIPVEGFLVRFAVRLALLPFIVGVSYEVIRAASQRRGSRFFRAAVAPGMWLQRAVTTRQPSDDQIEVAIHALNGALEVERAAAQPAPAGGS
ncbi:MAG: DUF1385 domain-containing protein [Candidatus Acidiferrales bacterium]